MKKGCIIALSVLIFVIIVASAWFFKSFAPKLQQAYTIRLIQDIESAIAKYEADHGKLGDAQHTDLLKIVRGNNPNEKDYFEGRIDGNIVEADIVDGWRRPLRFKADRTGILRFTSAGLNGEFGDGDDLTSGGLKGPKLPKPSR